MRNSKTELVLIKLDIIFIYLGIVEGEKDKQDSEAFLQCLNCQQELTKGDKFCMNCGQKTTASTLNLNEIIGNFLSNTFYFDSKMWRSYSKLIYPSKTTRAYVEGERKKYMHPFRLFFIAAIVFFSLINILTSKIMDKEMSFNSPQEKKSTLERYDLRTKLLDSISLDSTTIDHINYVGKLQPIFAKDTILRDTVYPLVTMVRTSKENELEMLVKSMNNRDLFELTPNEILDKYEVKGWWTRLNFKQSMRMSNKPLAGIKFIVNNFIWGVFLVIGICAWILKLLFFRRKKTYVEALLLLFEVHTIGFILASFGILIEYSMGVNNFNLSISIAMLISGIYFIIMLKRYYKEKLGWVLFKTFIFLLSYLVMFIIFMTLTSLIALAFF